MGFKKYRWYKIADRIEDIRFGANNIALAQLQNEPVCIGRSGDDLFAFGHQCPHAGGLMEEGHIDNAGHVICPVHSISFDMRSGENISGEGFRLKTWPVQSRKNGVYIGVVESVSFWKLFR